MPTVRICSTRSISRIETSDADAARSSTPVSSARGRGSGQARENRKLMQAALACNFGPEFKPFLARTFAADAMKAARRRRSPAAARIAANSARSSAAAAPWTPSASSRTVKRNRGGDHHAPRIAAPARTPRSARRRARSAPSVMLSSGDETAANALRPESGRRCVGRSGRSYPGRRVRTG